MKEETLLGFLLLISICCTVDSKCSKGCDLALASYNLWPESNLTIISELLQSTINDILDYNPQVPNQHLIAFDTRINVPFTCDCINDEFLGHVFSYNINSGDTYDKVATLYYANLTTPQMLQRFNSYGPNNILDSGELKLNVTVNCSCGDSKVSKHYGLFTTYPLQPNDSLSLVAAQSNVSEDVLRSYNPDSDFDAGNGLVFVPGRDKNGKFPPLESSAGKIIVDISVAGVAGFLLLSVCIYIGFFRKNKLKGELAPEICFGQADHGSPRDTASGSTGGASPILTGISVDKSVVFSYKELSKATDTFSLANKIGEGGFGSVYYAELRGEKAAIKKMNIQASKEFLTELKVLTHVHHLNLVRLIGYCVEVSLFLVYEYVDNGNLSQHLRGSERDPLPWSTRVQIALDSARGLEYMHEHTVPVYVHCDIKSANILIDKNFHGKVADFGLTKLIEAGRTSRPTCLVGTFGYMPPEYARFVSVSPQADVYAFGVVLYELISAKEAVVKQNESIAEPKGLVVLFADVFNQLDPREDLCKLIDPRLGDSYPFDSVHKMAQLARACTQENPQLRPTMRSIVVALMTLSSSTDDWDVGSSYENQASVRW